MDSTLDAAEYCRAIEAYLCQKNDGHLIRIVGPSFDRVSRWAALGVPLKVSFRGIDRYFERYYRDGPRRRPVRIDFCEADVLDVYDEWRRAVGLPMTSLAGADTEAPEVAKGARSLRAHLERGLLRLSSARATGVLGADADEVIDRIARELDAARESANGVRGDRRREMIARLAALDRELVECAKTSLRAEQRTSIESSADEELAAFRSSMPADAYLRARAAAIDHLVRERCRLPTLRFD